MPPWVATYGFANVEQGTLRCSEKWRQPFICASFPWTLRHLPFSSKTLETKRGFGIHRPPRTHYSVPLPRIFTSRLAGIKRQERFTRRNRGCKIRSEKPFRHSLREAFNQVDRFLCSLFLPIRPIRMEPFFTGPLRILHNAQPPSISVARQFKCRKIRGGHHARHVSNDNIRKSSKEGKLNSTIRACVGLVDFCSADRER